MTPEQIDLVRQSWKKVQPFSQTAGELFYDRLLDLDPKYDDAGADHVDQIKKLMSSLNLAVNFMEDPVSIELILDMMCQQHVGYGVFESDQENAQQAFCWTLMHGLGDAFTREVKEAWIEFFNMISSNTPTSSRLN